MPTSVRNYTIDREEVWERLIIFKDRRSRRKRVPTAAAASIRIDTTDYVIPTEITSEGGVKMYMTPEQTGWLVDGEYAWDMVVTVSRSANLTSSPLAETLAVRGTITVQTTANITPKAVDGVTTALEQVV